MNDMLEEFNNYIDKLCFVKPESRILMTVSGGIDSMVMANLFIKSGFNTGIAHCNFCLRDQESDLDEELVRKFADDLKIPFYVRRFDTKKYSLKKKISIQMAARELRYSWFEDVRKDNGYDFIALAHNLNDNIETFLINLIRGTGIAGLTGMKPVSGRLIRPLLFAPRRDIELYCRQEGVIYREDRSNSETRYTRNKIRHLVLPLLKEINPSIETTLNETAARLMEVNGIISDLTDTLKKDLFADRGNSIIINIDRLKPYLKNNALLFELLRQFGINERGLTDIRNITKGRTGGEVYTATHRFIKNRRELIITTHNEIPDTTVIIKNSDELKKLPFIASAHVVPIEKDFKVSSDPSVATIDSTKLAFPLKIRKWQKGDFFYPLGMQQKKKLSDFFVDKKFAKTDKENVLILESDGQIVWIIGVRLDERFKITGSTKNATIIKV